jgi:hypothetical protein
VDLLKLCPRNPTFKFATTWIGNSRVLYIAHSPHRRLLSHYFPRIEAMRLIASSNFASA